MASTFSLDAYNELVTVEALGVVTLYALSIALASYYPRVALYSTSLVTLIWIVPTLGPLPRRGSRKSLKWSSRAKLHSVCNYAAVAQPLSLLFILTAASTKRH